VMTTDNYPTSMRAVALGLGTAAARAASMASAFVGGTLVCRLSSNCSTVNPSSSE